MATELVDAGSSATEQGLVPEQAAVVVQTEPEGTAEEEPNAKQEPDGAVVTDSVDNRKYKYSRDEMVRFGKAPGNSVFPSGLELVGPELRDLDKRVPYERGLTREASLDSAACDAGPALKPSWAIGRFGQARPDKQAADGVAATKPPPPGFGLPANPIRSRLLEENTFRDDEPQQRGLGLGRLGNGAPAPWRGHDKEVDRDRERARDRQAREPWAIESPPEKGRPDNDPFKASPPEGRRAPGDRWEKPGDSWRGGGAAQQPAPAKEPWRGGAADRWGGAGDERATARDTHTRRPGGGWGDEGHGDRRRNDRQDAGDEDDGGIGDSHRAKGRGRGMTAAEMEAERLAFRKQLDADKQRKADKPGLRGIYEHEEVDLNDLMDDTQKGVAAQSSAPAAAVAGPPGFARPGYGVKMSFEQLAKAAASGEPPAPAVTPAQQQQPAKVGIALDELEKQLNVGPARGGFAAPFAAQGPTDQGAPGGAPPGAAPAGTFGFKADTNASMALLGMLNRGAGSQGGQGAPAASEGNGLSAAAPPGPAQAPPAGDAGDAGAKSFAALGLGALGGGNKIPASVLNAFGEGAVKEAYAAFPSLSSIWGAPAMGSGGLPPAPSPAAELPAGPASQHGMPPSTQAAAAALFEQLSNAAAAGSTARPPAPGAMQQQQQLGQQQQQPLPQQQQQQASNAIMALLGKQAGQQQQMPGAPRDAGLNALMAQYGRTAPQTRAPGGPAAHGTEGGGSSTPLADDNFNSMFKDLGISPEPPRPKEQANQPMAGTGAGIPGWPQQARPGVNPAQQQLPGQGGNQLTAKAVQELLAAAGTGQQRVGQNQQSSMQQLQQLLVNGQQQLNLQAALQQQQLHQQQLQQQQQPQQQQWTSNMLHAMQQQVAMRPGMGQQQQQQQPGAYPASLMQQQQQQMLQQQMQQRMQQQQQATQQANMAAVMQAAQQQRPQQGGFDPALLARLQGAMGLGGGAAPGQAHQQGHLQGMAANQGGNPLASALGIQHMMQMQQQLHAARAGAPQGGGMGGQAPAQAQHDPNNLARFFNAAALQQAQASALRQPQGAAMPTVADLERILGQRR